VPLGESRFVSGHRFSDDEALDIRFPLQGLSKMSVPLRNSESSSVIAGSRTFFVTSSSWGKRALLQSDRAAGLFIDVLYHYRQDKKYLLHEFVVMPEHFHLLITLDSTMTIEKAVQLIKGGFAFRAGKELGFRAPVWQKGFSEIRINDSSAYLNACG